MDVELIGSNLHPSSHHLRFVRTQEAIPVNVVAEHWHENRDVALLPFFDDFP
jgi:hypothetical protein